MGCGCNQQSLNKTPVWRPLSENQLKIVKNTIGIYYLGTVTKNVGDNVTFNAAVSGGTAPYTYTWTGLPSSISGANKNVLTGTVSTEGTYDVTVTVKDNTGATVSTTQTLVVGTGGTIPPTPLPGISDTINNFIIWMKQSTQITQQTSVPNYVIVGGGAAVAYLMLRG